MYRQLSSLIRLLRKNLSWGHVIPLTGFSIVVIYIVYGPSLRRKRVGKYDIPPGLTNFGNSCYLNSLLQALAASTSLRSWLADISGEEDGDSVREELLKLLRVLNNEDITDLSGEHTPEAFISALQVANRFLDPGQQDADELFHQIFSTIEDWARCVQPSSLISQRQPAVAVVNRGSIEGPPLRGHLITKLRCNHCWHESPAKKDHFHSLSLCFPSTARALHSLEDLVHNYFSHEHLADVHCDKCNAKRSYTKRMSIGELPDLLILHIRRTTWHSLHAPVKRMDGVLFRYELDMSPFVYKADTPHTESQSNLLQQRVPAHSATESPSLSSDAPGADLRSPRIEGISSENSTSCCGVDGSEKAVRRSAIEDDAIEDDDNDSDNSPLKSTAESSCDMSSVRAAHTDKEQSHSSDADHPTEEAISENPTSHDVGAAIICNDEDIASNLQHWLPSETPLNPDCERTVSAYHGSDAAKMYNDNGDNLSDSRPCSTSDSHSAHTVDDAAHGDLPSDRSTVDCRSHSSDPECTITNDCTESLHMSANKGNEAATCPEPIIERLKPSTTTAIEALPGTTTGPSVGSVPRSSTVGLTGLSTGLTADRQPIPALPSVKDTVAVERSSTDTASTILPGRSVGQAYFQQVTPGQTLPSSQLVHRYVLRSVIAHDGNASVHGHFITYRQMNSRYSDPSWVYTSDTQVRRADFEEVFRCQPYMLFYERAAT